ncbi:MULTISPECIES: thiol-activated cytolysin family protein [Deinococcus]|uniref:Thiol-activated cytolysin family protein n=1 Tax=Deinococcus rufus TaxID=2136097 RepID=A0ABV7Z4S5_9DEIO|nr:thiol-activated cytolysin family protein [Deinococcus sp. AB2017081]WQE95283.1 thiol-activated cytolysin family protein [Deinococcus sp. AB2017081]
MRTLNVSRHLLTLSLPLLVAACGSGGSPTDQTVADPPNFTGTAAGATTVNLRWDAVAGATSYTLERKTNTAAYSLIASPGAGTLNYADTTAQASTAYTYRVKAVSGSASSAGAVTSVTTPAGAAPQNPNAEAINAYASSLPSWAAFSPPIPDSDEASGPAVPAQITEDGVTYDCTTTPYGLARTPEKVVTFQPDASVFWPGVLLQGRGYADGLGSLKELPIRQRAPLAVSIDLLGNDNARTVDSPNLQTVTQAIGQLIAAAKAEGVSPGTSIDYQKQETNSSNEVALHLGLSARYMPLTVKATLDVNRKANETTITANFIEKAFTVSVVPPQTPAGFFSPDFTPALLDEQKNLGNVGPNNLPTYVSSITYGRILLFSFTASGSEQEIKATLDALYESASTGASVELSAAQKQLLSTASIKVTTVGGDSSNALALIRSGNISDYFETTTALETYKPISYEVRNLGDGSIAKVSETTSYNIRQCTARPKVPVKTGEEIQITLDRINVNDAGDGDLENGEVYGSVTLDGTAAWSANRDNAVSVGNGGVIDMNGQNSLKKEANLGSSVSFTVTGYFKDADSGLRGGDDDLGGFDTTITVPVPMTSGQYTTTLNDSNGSMTLVYTVKKTKDLMTP